MKKICLLVPILCMLALAPAWADDAKKDGKKDTSKKADVRKIEAAAVTIELKVDSDGKVEMIKGGQRIGTPHIQVWRMDANGMKKADLEDLQKRIDVPLSKLSPEAIQRLRRAHASHAAKPSPMSGLDAKSVFKAMDKDKDGKISFEEFEPAFKRVRAMHANTAKVVRSQVKVRGLRVIPADKKPCPCIKTPCCKKCPCEGKTDCKGCPGAKKACCDKCPCAKKTACCPVTNKPSTPYRSCPSSGKPGAPGCKGCPTAGKPCASSCKSCPVEKKATCCPTAKKAACCPKGKTCPTAGKPEGCKGCPNAKTCPTAKKPGTPCKGCPSAGKPEGCKGCPNAKTCPTAKKSDAPCKGCPSASKACASGCKSCPKAKLDLTVSGTALPSELILPLPDVKADKPAKKKSAQKKPAKKKTPKVKKPKVKKPKVKKPKVKKPKKEKPKKEKAPAIPADKMERFKAADKNNDGKLSKEEAPDFMKDKFTAMDKNKDGGLAPQEIHGYFMKIRAQQAKEKAKEKK